MLIGWCVDPSRTAISETKEDTYLTSHVSLYLAAMLQRRLFKPEDCTLIMPDLSPEESWYL